MKKVSSKQWKWNSPVVWALGIFVCVALKPAHAEMDWNAADDAAFPKSRFGAPPTSMRAQMDEVKAAKEVDAVDRAQRSPAGLKIGEDPEQEGRSGPPAPPLKMESRMESNPETQKLGLSRRGVQEVSLIAGDLGFFPRTLFVSRDVPVRLYVTGASKNTLCLMLDAFAVRKQVRAQKIEEITFLPSQPGNYRFYCPINGMEGHLVVRELSDDRGYSPVAQGSDPAPSPDQVKTSSAAAVAAPGESTDESEPNVKPGSTEAAPAN